MPNDQVANGPWVKYQAAPEGPWTKYAPKVSAAEQIEGDAISQGAREFAKDGSSALGGVSQFSLNALAGALRGAGSLGSTLMRPFESADANAQRREDMDKALGNIGAQTDSLTYRGGKLVGEVAGTAGAGSVVAAPLRAAAALAPKAAPALTVAADTIASGGFQTGAKMGRVADIATRVAGGAVAGGAAAGMVDPNDAAAGAAIGGALPPVVRGSVAAMDAAAKGIRNVAAVVSPKAARSVAVEKVATALGDDAAQAVADIGTHYPKGAEDIPLSAAAITRNPNLAHLEQGSRITTPATWFDFDQKQGRAVFDNVLRATGEADELVERIVTRQDNWKQLWGAAAQNLKPRLWVARMTQFGEDLGVAARSPEASNPAVRGVLEAIEAEMDRVGPAFGPAHLQQLRANLNGKVQPLSPDVFKSAPRDNPAIKSLIAEMDSILNTSTGGKWQKVLEGYAKDSDLVRAAKAAAKVRSSFVDEATGRIRGTTVDPAGDIPRVTEAGLGRAMDAARMPDKTLALSDAANQRLGATVDALRAQNVVQQLKRSATAGGGSDTVPNAVAAGMQAAGAPSLVTQLIGAVRRMGLAKTDNEMAALLANPDDLAKAVDDWLRLGRGAPPAISGPGAAAARALPVIGAGALAAPVGAEGLDAEGLDQVQQQPGAAVMPAAEVEPAMEPDAAVEPGAGAMEPSPMEVPPEPITAAPAAPQAPQMLQRITALKEAGEEDLAKALQSRWDRQQLHDSTQRELAGYAAAPGARPVFASPQFAAAYQHLRGTGEKPGAAAGRAALATEFQQLAQASGISEKAVRLALDHAGGKDLAEVGPFLQRYVSALASRGHGNPEAVAQIGTALAEAWESAVDLALSTVYPEQPDAQQEQPAAEVVEAPQEGEQAALAALDEGAEAGGEAAGADVRGDPAGAVPGGSTAAVAEPEFSAEPRADGTLMLRGDPAAIRDTLVAAGIPEGSLMTARGGVAVGRTQAKRVQSAIDSMQAAADIDEAAHEAATSPLNDRPEPTQAQAEAGNYRKGHIRFHGMDISVENPKGSTRRGVAPDGTPWESELQSHYGYVLGSKGNDGDHVDVFVGPHADSKRVYVVDQLHDDGRFDEHKAMLGYRSEEQAREAYLANYDAGWESHIGGITELPIGAFKSWVKDGKKRQPLSENAEGATA